MTLDDLEEMCVRAEAKAQREGWHEPVINLRVPGHRPRLRALVARPNLLGQVVSHLENNQTAVVVRTQDARRWLEAERNRRRVDQLIETGDWWPL